MTGPTNGDDQTDKATTGPSQDEVHQVLKRFRDLYQQARTLLLPRSQIRQWFLAPETSDAPMRQRFVFLVDRVLLVALGLLANVVLAALTFILFDSTADPTSNSTSQTAGAAGFAVFMNLLALFAWGRWLFFLFKDTSLPRRTRVIWFGVTFLISFAVYPAAFALWGEYDIGLAPDPANWIYVWIVAAVRAIFPLVSFSILLWFLLISSAWRFFLMMLRFHSPSTDKQIAALVIEPIPPGALPSKSSAESGQKWWLAELDAREADSLFRRTARDIQNVERRLVPTAIFFAVIGVFVEAISTTRFFQDAIETSIRWLLPSQSPLPALELLPRELIIALLIGLGTIFFLTYVSLLERMAVLGLILETEPLVRYFSCEQELDVPEDDPNTKGDDAPPSRNLLSRLFDALRQ